MNPTAAASLRTATILLVFALVGTGLLAFTHQQTKAPLAEAEARARLALIGQIMPADRYTNDLLATTVLLPATPELGTSGPTRAHLALRGGQRAGAVFEAIAPDGYAGRIRLLIAVADQAGGAVVSGVRVIAHQETPGLGDYIDPSKDRASPKWISQFDAPPPNSRWQVRKDGGDFSAYAGATITPRAVVKAVGRALAYYNAHPERFQPPAARP